ncbi:hypothetical protein F8388_011995 [Cannabis sativa]|uniref:Uncharacterized protein n=1 Tax=Cannabis sativa TaxID=3483 RepID=A0A7J6GDQ7_CANSA|nr:hypothetical protein F8388_011995 [Cannabis sativa]KAF4381470.1 hypothetical protein G4B88_029825 [Cannabis sativa]
MAQVLVLFYPLAGEVVYNTVGEPEILCNNRGVDFIEACADAELEKLNLYNFDVSFVVGKLVPAREEIGWYSMANSKWKKSMSRTLFLSRSAANCYR